MEIRMIDEIYETMPWDEIDSIVFDVGNVLLSFNPNGIVKKHFPDDPLLQERLLNAVFRTPYWIYQDMGICNIPEACELMVKTDPEIENEIRVIMNSWLDSVEPVTEGLRVLEACKKHGKKVYILSNYGYDAFASLELVHDFLAVFDGKIISSRVHLVKPDPTIYRLLTDSFNCEPSRTLFIDDVHANIAGAISCGWRGILYNRQGKLDRFFA